MRILITGGNGYVGRTLTRMLAPSHEVTVIDNLRSGALRLDKEDLARIDFRQADIRDKEAVESIFAERKPEAVVHLAAVHFIPECEQEPAEAIGINVLGTMNLLRAADRGTRFVFASSAAVYAPEDHPHREESSPTGPMDIYGLTKLQGEDYIRYSAERLGLNAVIVRLFNVIGPGETNPHILPAILAQALKGETKLRLGNCHPKRDYIDVTDAAAGFAAIALGKPSGEPVEVVNLGTGEAFSVYELVEELARVSDLPFEIETDPTRVRKSDRPFLAADNNRIASRYGWQRRMNLRSSLQELWRQPDIPQSLLEAS
ncbi:MAG: UDP-glucose 4-epimerase [Bryobacterales bacterium]|nr:UDP-glucose 4-epimerase [Bryobacterales bacterium]